jgi:membrane fusion protein (multidrug efflux system)
MIKLRNMKQLLAIVSSIVLLVSCGQPASAPGGDDLISLREQLKEKQTQVLNLNLEIDALQLRIAELDTTTKSRRLVTVDTLKKSDFKHFVDIQATIQSDEIVNVSSEMPGRIVQLLIKEGQTVARGQLIAKLDVENMQKQMEELETALSLAETVFERQSRLWEQKIGSEIQYLEAKNNKERLEKSMTTIKSQIKKSNIYAPTSGVVDRLVNREGEFANPGMPIAVIINLNKLKVQAEVPEIYVGLIKKGDKVKVKFPTIGEDVLVTVTLIGKTISPSNRTFKVEAALPASKNDLWKPNLLALMSISDFEAKNAVQVPVFVVQQEASGKNFVLVVKEDTQGLYASKTYVKIGKSYDNQVLIEEGLNGDEVIILDGARGLANNELIDIATK